MLHAESFVIQNMLDGRILIKTTVSQSKIKSVKGFTFSYSQVLDGFIVNKSDVFDIIDIYTKLQEASTGDSKVVMTNNELSLIGNRYSSDTEEDDSLPFTNMTYKSHGGGFLLVPNSGKKDPLWGYAGNKETNYFHGGWWREDLGGWFFRHSLLEVLTNNGASEKRFESPKPSRWNVLPEKLDSDKTTKIPDSSSPFINMSYQVQGGGYLLVPDNGENDPFWGYTGSKDTNYFHGGWWKEDLGGWFFRKSLLNTLIENGAKNTNEQYDNDRDYRKGRIIVSSSDDDRDYYKNGCIIISSDEDEEEEVEEEESESELEEFDSEEETDSSFDYVFWTRIRNRLYEKFQTKGNILVVGETENNSGLFENMGGKYNKSLRGYIFDETVKNDLIELGIRHISERNQ